MAVQDRQMITRFKSQIEKEKLPLDKDWKKNLETHKIIDLLADREAESVQKCLAKHPEVEIVSRDRGGCYVDGATWGAPQATQVADRWHILSNLYASKMIMRPEREAEERPLFLLLLAANASRRHVSYASGSCISGCRNCTQLG